MEVRFTIDDAQRAVDTWDFNCGPGALCAILDMTPEEIRPHMGDFEKKGYTNPKLMREILECMNVKFRLVYKANDPQAEGLIVVEFGLQRIQWGGPWTKNGVPMRARYRHTHWIAVAEKMVFDVNAMCIGGWMPAFEWRTALVPWLIRECEPGADGTWWPTHGLEVVHG